MFSALAIASMISLAPAQGGLSVTNVRPTYGELGSTRPDNKYLPFDYVYVSFDIDGLSATPDGTVDYTMSLEVLDKAGKAIVPASPTKQGLRLPLGGGKLPAFIFLTLGSDMPAGPYVANVSITDNVGKATKKFEQKFEVVPPTFGIVGLSVSKDAGMTYYCGQSGIAGQTVYVNFALVNFARDAAKKPNAAVEFRVLDAQGKPTNAQPLIVEVRQPPALAEKESIEVFQFMLPLNREGSFTIELKAADKIGGKTASLSIPIRVHPASK